jgi:hypothetical protein
MRTAGMILILILKQMSHRAAGVGTETVISVVVAM